MRQPRCWLGAAAALIGLLRHWPPGSTLPRSAFVAAVCLWLAGTPYRNDLGLGQNCVYSLALTLAALFFQERQQAVPAGGLLALGLFKYAYVAPLVLFFFMLNRGWRTLLVAGLIHGVAHLLLCVQMGAHPVAVLGDVLRGNAHVFNRNAMLTFWTPFRTLADWLAPWRIPADALGASALIVAVGGTIAVWRRRPAVQDYPAWIFMLGLLSILAVTAGTYHLAYVLAGWLWCFPVPNAPPTRWPRLVVVACLGYLTLLHRLAEAVCAGQGWSASPWLPRIFNGGLLMLCLAGLVLFLRTVGTAVQDLPEAARAGGTQPGPVPR